MEEDGEDVHIEQRDSESLSAEGDTENRHARDPNGNSRLTSSSDSVEGGSPRTKDGVDSANGSPELSRKDSRDFARDEPDKEAHSRRDSSSHIDKKTPHDSINESSPAPPLGPSTPQATPDSKPPNPLERADTPHNYDTSANDSSDDDDEFTEALDSGGIYHKLGFMFFCAALLVGFVCVLASTLLVGKASTVQLKFIFSGLYTLFVALLFMCLCCTYYFGGSSTAWEVPDFSGVRPRFSTIVALLSLIVEFLQICSFAFNTTVNFSDVGFLRYANFIAVPAVQGSAFEAVFWAMFVMAFLPYIFVICVRIVIFIYASTAGEESAQKVVEVVQDKIYSVLWFLVNTLYFPIIGTMVSSVDCTFNDDGDVTLDQNDHIKCLEGRHIAFIVCSMIAFIIYYPAASFAQAQTVNISDIKFNPRVVFVMLQGKFILAVVTIPVTTIYALYFFAVIALTLSLLLINIVYQPCLVLWVNRMRTVFFAFCIWSGICSSIAAIVDDGSRKEPLILFVLGIAFFPIIGALSFVAIDRLGLFKEFGYQDFFFKKADAKLKSDA